MHNNMLQPANLHSCPVYTNAERRKKQLLGRLTNNFASSNIASLIQIMKSVAARAIACASVKRVGAARSFASTPVLCVQVDESPVSITSYFSVV